MFIHNRDQQDQLKIVRHLTCTWCKRELDYPRIVVDDVNASSYHVPCALHLAADVLDDLQDLLESQDAAVFNRIAVTNLFMRGKPGSSQQQQH